MKPGFLNITLYTSLFVGFGLTTSAQKVNELQEVSIVAPHSLKIDGKNFEWAPENFSVNKRTSISYLMSNDDKNLYLIVKSTDVMNNSKIMAGGITLSINPDGKKKEKESLTLTYPNIVRMQRGGGGPGGGGRMQGRAMGMSMFGGGPQSAKQRDSVMAAMQKTQLAAAKEIKISGFRKTTDTLVSIYNQAGIKAFASIDTANVYFYEAAIPLEELGLSVDEPKEFAYNIKLNGLQIPGFDGGFGGGGRGGRGGFGGQRGGGMDFFQTLSSPTDFWGKYVLIKK